MRILPGIMPILSPARLHRMIELTDERMPTDLLALLESAESTEEKYAVGIEHASELSRELLEGGASGLHLYTFNKHQAVLSVLESVGLYSPTPSPTNGTVPTKEHA